MKFPGGDRLRRLKDSLFPDREAAAQAYREEMLAAIQAEVDAKQRAQEAEANELRLGCANRLRPYIGRLFLVNNFKWIKPEESAARVSSAILANFVSDTPLGISAILSDGRGNHQELLGTADALKVAFEGRTTQSVFSTGPQYEGSDLWLLSLARAAEDTARDGNVSPDEVGCIAVASALDMKRHANIPWVPAPGAAFKLAGISEEARFDWQTVSVHPEDEQLAAALEEMKQFRQDPGNFPIAEN